MATPVLARPAPAPRGEKAGPEQEQLSSRDDPARRARPRLKVRVRPLDALLPMALALWFAGVHAVEPTAMNDYGLLPALPVIFFVGLGLLVVSIVAVLVDDGLSPLRLGLHLVALVLVLHATIPLIFAVPNFPWAYKHIGVVRYINLHGTLDPGVDIYHNWPGFFSLAAWFTKISGVASPLSYAAWAPVYFNLLTCLELHFVFRALRLNRRVHWLGLFVFVAGNWVGQDYFAPQALAFVLSLAVFGMVLAWFHVDRPPALVRAIRRLAARARLARPGAFAAPPGAVPSPPSKAPALCALFVAFVAIVITHQLSPYIIVLGVGLLTTAGLVRPRWIVVALAAIAIGYLLLRFSYIDSTQDLFGSLGDPLSNIHGERSDSVAMRGRRLTALAAPALITGLWTLGAIGVVRRLRAGRSALTLAILAAAPALVVVGQNYGGEAVFRIYLFSLPWTAALAASALAPWASRSRLWSAFKIGTVLAGILALFLSAFYGAEELYVVRPGEVAASQYFYDHAEPASILSLVASNFPTRVGERYDQFQTGGDNPPNLLSTVDQFRHRMLGAADLPAISEFVDHYVTDARGGRYLALSTGQQVYAEVLGLLPKGSMDTLERALDESPDWRVFYRNLDAVIYQTVPARVEGEGGEPPGPPQPPPPPPLSASALSPEPSVDWAALATGGLGISLVAAAWTRRRRMAVHHHEVADEEEDTMAGVAEVNGSAPEGGAPEATDAVPVSPPGPSAPSAPPGRPVAPDAGTLEVTAQARNLEDLLRRALVAPADARERLERAISDLEPEPGSTRFRDLITSVEPGHRADAVRLLGRAWGPVPIDQLRPLLGDLSNAVRTAAVEVLEVTPDAVALLRQILSEDLSAQVRVATARALGQAPEPDQLAALSVALRDPDADVRATAVGTLPAGGATRAARLLLGASEDPDKRVRVAAHRRILAAPSWILWMALERRSQHDGHWSELLEEVPEDRVAALVAERICSPQPGDRVVALRLAGRLRTPQCVSEALRAMQDPEPLVRRAAVAQLSGFPQVASALVAVLHDDPDPAVRLGAVGALADMETDDALLALIGALQDPDPAVRGAAGRALVQRPSAGLATRIAAVLTPANVNSVGDMLLGMGAIGEEALIGVLAQGPGEGSSAAAELLMRSGRTGKLLEGLGAVDPTVRFRAVEALGAMGGSYALDGLVTALSDSWAAIRSRAAFYLGRIDDPRARGAVQRARESDQSPEVVQAAAAALREIDARERGTDPGAARPG